MRMRRMIILAMAVALFVGCSAGVGEHGTRLLVDESEMTSQVLYMLPDVSQIPFTGAELDEQGFDASEAIPVRVEIFDTTAVAWFAPDGEARIGPEWIIALWSVERVPMSTTYTDGESTTAQPSDAYVQANVPIDQRATYGIDYSAAQPENREATIIEFLDRLGTAEELAHLEELISFHPGCFEE